VKVDAQPVDNSLQRTVTLRAPAADLRIRWAEKGFAFTEENPR